MPSHHQKSYTYSSVVRLLYFFFIFAQIWMKFGTKVGHGTLTTGKILVSGYLGNGCHGDEKNALNSQLFPRLRRKCTRKVHYDCQQNHDLAVTMVQVTLNLLFPLYYQCKNPSIIVRQHDQGASTYILCDSSGPLSSRYRILQSSLLGLTKKYCRFHVKKLRPKKIYEGFGPKTCLRSILLDSSNIQKNY